MDRRKRGLNRRIRREIVLIIYLVLILGFIAWKKIEPTIREKSGNEPETGRAVEIYDGDTFKMADGMTVRLLGVDAPASNTGSLAAKNELIRLIRGKKLTLKYGGNKKDDFGRLAAWVWVDNKLVQQELLEKNLVVSNVSNLSKLVEAGSAN